MLLVRKYVHHLHLLVRYFTICFFAQFPVCSVQNQAPGSPISNVFIMRLCMVPYVINRVSEKLAGSFVLPEDGGSFSPEQTGNGLRKLHVVIFDTTASLHVHHRENLKSHVSLLVSRLLGRVVPFLCPRSPFRIPFFCPKLQQWATSQHVCLPCPTSCAIHNQQSINLQLFRHFTSYAVFKTSLNKPTHTLKINVATCYCVMLCNVHQGMSPGVPT